MTTEESPKLNNTGLIGVIYINDALFDENLIMSQLAKDNLIIIEKSHWILSLATIALAVSLYFFGASFFGIFWGVSAGTLMAFVLPVLWKKQNWLLNYLLSMILLLILPVFVFPSFELESRFFESLLTSVISFSAWCLLRKKQLTNYLT